MREKFLETYNRVNSIEVRLGFTPDEQLWLWG